MRIFFLCPNDNHPSGGIKKIYQHVDILNKNGFEAYVLHNKVNFRCDWFENISAIAYPMWSWIDKLKMKFKHWQEKIFKSPNPPLYPIGKVLIFENRELEPINTKDIVVIPELWISFFYKYLYNQSYVIFNQNAYLTFNLTELPKKPFKCGSLSLHQNAYSSPCLLGVIAVSKENIEYLKSAFPDCITYKVRISVAPNKFRFNACKKKQIVFMPRKMNQDSLQVINLLNMRRRLTGWTIVPIDKMREEQVAEIMQESWIFLSFSFEEGFGLPPLEAILSGCVVIGYDGGGGKDFFYPPYAIPIVYHDIIRFVSTIEKVALEIENNPDSYALQTKKNAEELYKIYSEENEVYDVVATWRSITNDK